MSQLFKNKYRLSSVRLPGYDYSQAGAYFVTICSQDRLCWFGEIKNSQVILSKSGKIINKIWQLIPQYFENSRLDEFIIMPNHLHGIIILNESYRRHAINRVPTTITTNTINGGVTGMYNPMLSNDSLPKIIRWFKGRCTYEIRKKFPDQFFRWQPRFYEHVIRDDISLKNIREYIRHNPLNYNGDNYHPNSG